MTGHSISTEQSEGFLSTIHTMIDDLDTISSDIDDNTYLRLVNGLQRLYNIHNSSDQSPNSVTSDSMTRATNQRPRETYRENFLDNNEVEITRILAQHYGRVYDSSGVLISNEPYPINNDVNTNTNNNPIITNVNTNTNNNPIITNAITNTNNNPIITNVLNNNTNNDNDNDNDNEFNEELLRESVAYRALYNAPYDYWNHERDRNSHANAIAR
jgi:hypothetical protein